MALTVEDGTQIVGAESYVTVQEYKDYLTKFYNITTDDDDATIEALVRRNTQRVDAIYGSQYTGDRKGDRSEQGLPWPRTSGYYSDGEAVAEDVVPDAVKNTVTELCKIESVDGVALAEPSDTTNVRASKEELGDLKDFKAYFAGGSLAPYMPTLDLLIVPVLRGPIMIGNRVTR